MEQLDDAAVERALRWAVIEQGTADISDTLGPQVIVSAPPRLVTPGDAAVAGRVELFRRLRPTKGERPPSSFGVLRRALVPGVVVLVQCDPDIGAAFGSNIALQAAACRAQAIVTDGTCRDTSRLRRVGIPVVSNGAEPTRPAGCPMVGCDSLDLFGVTWHRGDWFLLDGDGVLRLDAALAQRTAADLAESGSGSGELASLLSTPAPAEDH